MSRLMINASELADDVETADFLFEVAGGVDNADPLTILLQRELDEEELYGDSWFHRVFN